MIKQMLIFAIFGLLVALAVPVPGYAQNPSVSVKAETEAGVMVPKSVMLVQAPSTYALPYPGILPDHPLYFLKSMRDTMVEWLISDPLRKAEFFAVQSDKSMNTALFMMQKNNLSLVIATVTQASEYRLKALSQMQLAVDAGKNTQPLLEKLRQAIVKHQEVLTDLQSQAGNEAAAFEEFRVAATSFADQLQQR